MKRPLSFLLGALILTAPVSSIFAWGGQPARQTVYDVRRGGNYETDNCEIVRQQLAKGGFRLAKLLDAIYAK